MLYGETVHLHEDNPQGDSEFGAAGPAPSFRTAETRTPALLLPIPLTPVFLKHGKVLPTPGNGATMVSANVGRPHL